MLSGHDGNMCAKGSHIGRPVLYIVGEVHRCHMTQQGDYCHQMDKLLNKSICRKSQLIITDKLYLSTDQV